MLGPTRRWRRDRHAVPLTRPSNLPDPYRSPWGKSCTKGRSLAESIAWSQATKLVLPRGFRGWVTECPLDRERDSAAYSAVLAAVLGAVSAS